MTLELLELVAVFACTLFASAAIYINAVEHPARLSCGTEVAARQWAPSYKRATVTQVSLAAVAVLSGLALGFLGGGPLWLWGIQCSQLRGVTQKPWIKTMVSSFFELMLMKTVLSWNQLFGIGDALISVSRAILALI